MIEPPPCERCGEHLVLFPDGFWRCPKCGSNSTRLKLWPVPESRGPFCPHCGGVVDCSKPPLSGYAWTCPHCGKPMDRVDLVLMPGDALYPSPEKIKEYMEKTNTAQTNPLDVQVGGGHYKGMKIQPVEFCHANGLGFLEGSVIKYVCRHRNKNKRQDLEKARHFLDLLIALEYPEKPEDPPDPA